MYRLKNKEFILIILFLMLIILSLNTFTPMWNDEFAYSFIGGTDKKVSGFIDIIKSQYYYFQNWTGRNIIHFIVQLFCWLGKDVFNMFNTLVFFIYLISIFLITDKKRNFLNLLFIFSLVWLTAPVPGETIFWLAGSVNYLWATAYMLLYIVIEKKIENVKIIYLLSFILGWLHENIFILMGAYFFLELLINKKITKERILKIVFFLLGSIFLILAPGNFKRNKMMYGYVTFDEKVNGFFSTIKIFLDQEKLILIFFIIFLFTILFKYKKLKISKEEVIKYVLFSFIGFFSNFVMILSPEFPLRTTFASYSFI